MEQTRYKRLQIQNHIIPLKILFDYITNYISIPLESTILLGCSCKQDSGLSHLNEHKFKHNFRDFLNALCACNLGPETTFHYLLRCHLFQIEQRTLPNFFSKQLIYTKAVLIQNVY